MKPCFGKCARCVWRNNGGCSEWNGFGEERLTREDTIIAPKEEKEDE